MQRLIENNGKRIGKLRLKPTLEQKRESPPAKESAPAPVSAAKEKESPPTKSAKESPALARPKEPEKKMESPPKNVESSPLEPQLSPEAKSIDEKGSTPGKSKGKSPAEDSKAHEGSAGSANSNEKSPSEEAKAKRRRDIRERFGMPHAKPAAAAEAPDMPAMGGEPEASNDILVEGDQPKGAAEEGWLCLV